MIAAILDAAGTACIFGGLTIFFFTFWRGRPRRKLNSELQMSGCMLNLVSEVMEAHVFGTVIWSVLFAFHAWMWWNLPDDPDDKPKKEAEAKNKVAWRVFAPGLKPVAQS